MLAGVTGEEEQWRYCITDTDNVIGFALGAMFVTEAFKGNRKDKVRDAARSNMFRLKNTSLYECITLYLYYCGDGVVFFPWVSLSQAFEAVQCLSKWNSTVHIFHNELRSDK